LQVRILLGLPKETEMLLHLVYTRWRAALQWFQIRVHHIAIRRETGNVGTVAVSHVLQLIPSFTKMLKRIEVIFDDFGQLVINIGVM
jgi:hypothetical protein